MATAGAMIFWLFEVTGCCLFAFYVARALGRLHLRHTTSFPRHQARLNFMLGTVNGWPGLVSTGGTGHLVAYEPMNGWATIQECVIQDYEYPKTDVAYVYGDARFYDLTTTLN